MRRASRDRLREVARSAFWLIPSLCVVAAIGLAIGLVFVDHEVGSTRTGFLFPGPPAGARTFLSSIIQAMITFTGLVFSITIVVLQLTSSQFSPRVLRTFLRDRTIQLSLGVFVATFVYAMVVLREVRGTGGSGGFVPRLAVTVTFVLVLLSVGLFIRYVAHIANMIRLASIVDSIGREARAALARCPRSEPVAPEPSLGSARRTVGAPRPGVLVAVNAAAIVREGRAADCQFVLLPRVGDYLPEGAPLLRVHGPGDVDDDRLVELVSFDLERTLEQDLAFAFRQLVDIAQRALSPGVNDPTTAVQAIDVEHDLLRRLATRPLESGCHTDPEGTVRLVVPVVGFGDYLDLAIGQIWPDAADKVQVPARVRALLDDLAQVARPEYRSAIGRWADAVECPVQRSRDGPLDSAIRPG
jgi:uncharacterized membrane protein